MSDRGVLYIVSSPSGGGKTTLIKRVIEAFERDGLGSYFSVSHTTRAPREGEADGTDYHFVDHAGFDALIATDGFLEWAEYAGHRYGTSKAEVEGRLGRGVNVFLDIEVQGAQQVKTTIQDAVKIFIYPPSYEELKKRLIRRRQNDPAAIRRRLETATRELASIGEFDYAIVNDDLDLATRDLLSICRAERHRTTRVKLQLAGIRESFRHAFKNDEDGR